MKFNLFKRKKNKINIIKEETNQLIEKEELILKIGIDKIDNFCLNTLMDKEDLSISFLKKIIKTPSLLENLKFLDKTIIDKINNDALTLDDISIYNLDLIKLSIFNESEEKRLEPLNKELKIKNDNYLLYSSEKFTNEIKTRKKEEIIPSYIDNVNLIITKHVLPIENDFIFDFNNNYNFLFSGNKTFDKETIVNFDNDTIIVVSYEDYLVLSKNNIDLLDKYNFVLKEQYDKINNLITSVNLNNFNKTQKNDDYSLLKINHLLYLINNSKMEEKFKKYYSYHLKEEYSQKIYFYDLFSLTSELTEKLDNIDILTQKFNSLSYEEKTKFINKDEFTKEVFLASIDLDNIKALDLLKKISFLKEEEKELVLEDINIKTKLQEGFLNEAKNDQYRYFREVMKYLSIKDFFQLYTAKKIKSFYSNRNNGEEYKLFVCLCEKNMNEVIDYVLKDDYMFKEFFRLNDYFYSMFCNLDYDKLKKIVFKMENDNLDYRFDFVSSCGTENQIKLLNEELKDSTILKLLNYMNVDSINHFFQNNIRSKHLYKEVNIPALLSNNVKFSDDIVKNKDFFDLLV